VRSTTTFLLCLAVLAILAVVSLPRFNAFVRTWEAKPRLGEGFDICGGIKVALGGYQVDNGTYPQSLQDLLKQPAGATNWRGPYLDKLPLDPWSKPFIYYFPGKHNTNGYDLLSAGPDGKEGTSDDLVNWQQ
jgi:general secretion pathway protein G